MIRGTKGQGQGIIYRYMRQIQKGALPSSKTIFPTRSGWLPANILAINAPSECPITMEQK